MSGFDSGKKQNNTFESMMLSLIFIGLCMVWIIIGTSYLKLHPFPVLLFAVLLLSFLIDIPAEQIPTIVGSGFGKIIQNIGLLIIYGTIIGVALEKSGGTLAIAKGLLKYLSKLPLSYVVSCIGYLVSIPVFCDAAFVILSHLNKTLAAKTKTPLIGLTVALSTGLFAPHVLVPPTPGPLAAAANLSLNNLFLLIVTGGITAFILVLIGAFYAHYLSKKATRSNSYLKTADTFDAKKVSKKIVEIPSFSKSIAPILIPIFLMCLGTLITPEKLPYGFRSLFLFMTHPTQALLMGVLFAFNLVKKEFRKFINTTVSEGIRQAAPILIITGMGGALGAVIQQIPLEEYVQTFTRFELLGIFIPFAIAAFLKTAQGSSTVAIITTSSIIFPLLPLLGLDSEMGKVWAIMALGVGSMTVSHANDSYFWIVSQMGGMDVKTAYRTHTWATFMQGMVGMIIVFVAYTLWKVL